jgi:hypothetical protein
MNEALEELVRRRAQRECECECVHLFMCFARAGEIAGKRRRQRMNLSIEIPDEIGNEMQKRAIAAGKDLATFVGQVVVENAKEVESETHFASSVDDFIRRQKAWVNLHPKLDHVIDDSRESIYVGRE